MKFTINGEAFDSSWDSFRFLTPPGLARTVTRASSPAVVVLRRSFRSPPSTAAYRFGR